MIYTSKRKKFSGFTNYTSVDLDDQSVGLKDGGNAKYPIQALIDKVADVYGASFRVFSTESELVASDIALDEYAIVEENGYGFYKITNDTVTGRNIALTSGLTATYSAALEKSATSYDDLRSILTAAKVNPGDTVTLATDALGQFLIVDNSGGEYTGARGTFAEGGTLAAISDNSEWHLSWFDPNAAGIDSREIIQAAVDATPVGATLFLDADVSVDPSGGSVVMPRNITLDLNGYTVTRIGTNDDTSMFRNEGSISNAGISNITQANPGVAATSAAHNFETGQWVVLEDIGGMIELDYIPIEITVLTATTFELTGVDTTLFNAYTSGGQALPLDNDIKFQNGTMIGTGSNVGISDQGHCIQFFRSLRGDVENMTFHDCNGDAILGRLDFDATWKKIRVGNFGRNAISPTSGYFHLDDVRIFGESLPLANPGLDIDIEPDNARENCKIFLNNVRCKNLTMVDFYTPASGDFLVELSASNCVIGPFSVNTVTVRSTNNTNAKNIKFDATCRVVGDGTNATGFRIKNVNDVIIEGTNIDVTGSISGVSVNIEDTVQRLNLVNPICENQTLVIQSFDDTTDSLEDSIIRGINGRIYLSGHDNIFRGCKLDSITLRGAATTGNVFDVDTPIDSDPTLASGALDSAQTWNNRSGVWSPSFTGLTEVGGAAAISGRYNKNLDNVSIYIKIVPVTSTQSVAGSTYSDLPFPAAFDSTSIATAMHTGLGNSDVEASTDRCYTATWNTGSSIYVSATYKSG